MNAKDELIHYLKTNYESLKSGTSDGYYLEGDREYVIRFNNQLTKTELDDYRLVTELLPQPLCGDINNGKIFICSLNPGFEPEDLYIEGIEKGINIYPNYKEKTLNLLCQDGSLDNSMFFLSEEDVTDNTLNRNSGGATYWRKKLNQQNKEYSLVHALMKGFNNNGFSLSENKVFELLSRWIVTIELFPYHSKKFHRSLLDDKKYSFKSVNMMRDYVCDYLIPNAEKYDILVIFTRSTRAWGVNEHIDNERIIKGASAQNPSYNVKLNVGSKILNYIKRITDDFKTLQI